jgi:formate dehydrogenase iron-sulfur subunit
VSANQVQSKGRALAWPSSYDGEAKPRVGFFTDTTLCIGCKACEVACKEWNNVPEDSQGFSGESYDNSGALGANRWRHVAFIEQRKPVGITDAAPDSLVKEAALQSLVAETGIEVREASGESAEAGDGAAGMRWLMSSDVCKHCTDAACLDVCPTGALFRTEFGTVVVQDDVCNGCGYCVPACPFGVLDRREGDGRVWKCTLCYDRLKDDLEPACAKACPTDSIQFGELAELRERAERRVSTLHDRGSLDARLYGDSPDDGVGGFGAFFLLLDEPETYGLPPDPVVTTRDLPGIWKATGLAAVALGAGVLAAFAGGRR